MGVPARARMPAAAALLIPPIQLSGPVRRPTGRGARPSGRAPLTNSRRNQLQPEVEPQPSQT